MKTAPLTNQATSIFDVQCGEATHYLVSPSKPEENSSEWSVCNTGEKEVTLIEGTNTFPFWFKRGSYLVESAQTIEVLLDTAAPSPPSSILGGVSMGSLVRSPSIQYSSGTDAQSGVLKNQVRVLKVSDSAVIRDWTDHEPGEPILGLSLVALESYRVELRSVDMAGNLSSSVSSSDWIAGRAQGIHDVDFANGGVYSTSGNYVSNEAKKIIFAPNQKILVTGLIRDLGEWGDIFLHRLLPNGVPDSSFGTNGKIVIDLTPFDFGTGLFIDSMNRIILGGAYTTTENPFLYRFTNSGSIDSSFGTNGFVAKSVAGENFARAMTVDPSDGSYYIVGDDYGDSAYVTKFTVNGAVDNTFATSGYYLIGTHVYAYALDAEVDLNGKLVVVGRVKPGGSGDDWAAILWRFNSNGTLDTSFNSPSGYLLLDDQLSANVTESANGL
ncbi:MAG: hypothetical protein KDD35_11530, partial [Bdellovibrionales bacterium]|nr:hypothetical protein [Bdellovibrionales bacterium]